MIVALVSVPCVLPRSRTEFPDRTSARASAFRASVRAPPGPGERRGCSQCGRVRRASRGRGSGRPDSGQARRLERSAALLARPNSLRCLGLERIGLTREVFVGVFPSLSRRSVAFGCCPAFPLVSRWFRFTCRRATLFSSCPR